MWVDFAIERYQHLCRQCSHRWTRDYDLRVVTEPDGDEFDYYSLEGHPVPAPHAPDALTCPACGSPSVTSTLLARRDTPHPDTHPAWPRQPTPTRRPATEYLHADPTREADR